MWFPGLGVVELEMRRLFYKLMLQVVTGVEREKLVWVVRGAKGDGGTSEFVVVRAGSKLTSGPARGRRVVSPVKEGGQGVDHVS